MDSCVAATTTAAVVSTAVLGSLASTGVRSTWYRELDKPAFQPPGAVFGPVWTLLYTDLAVNLVLNAGWSWVFFRAQRLLPAVLVAGALAASSADLVRRTAQADGRAAAALAPYPAWCSFATVLSTALWRRNR